MRSSVVYQYAQLAFRVVVLPEVIACSCATGSDVNHVTRSDVITGSMFWTCPAFTHVFSYYSSRKCSTVVQVPGLPEVTEGHVTPKGFHLGEVCACATESGAIFVLVETFHRKWRHQTSRGLEGIPLEGWGARMRNQMLRNIRSNATRRASPGKYRSAHARPQVHLVCSVGYPRLIIVF
jgi:hypothetical protein